MIKCNFCNYISEKKFNLLRHIHNKHSVNMQNNEKMEIEEKVNLNEEKVNLNEEKVNPFEEKVNLDQLSCKKCNKVYKTKKYLNIHELKCNKIDNLTCPKCMISFTKKQAKSRHIKANNCKARSIIHARIPNVQNIITNIENQTINNNHNNTTNYIINNFGSERIDHISHEEIVKMLTSGTNTLPLYIKKKHFDKNFPENNNIKYTLENRCKVFEDSVWKDKDLSHLSSSLIQDNTEVLLLYCNNNNEEVLNTIQDIDKYEHVRDKLFILYNKTDNMKYNTIITKIKDLIKNCDINDL